MSDPTNLFALEAARPLPAETHLVTAQRVVRAQPAPKGRATRSISGSTARRAGIEQRDHGFSLAHAYYAGGLRFMLWVTAPDGTELPLRDGGTFDWLARLTSNRRAVFVASGLGAQLVALRFRA